MACVVKWWRERERERARGDEGGATCVRGLNFSGMFALDRLPARAD